MDDCDHETLAVTEYLRMLAADTPELPDPSLVWWRAQAAKRHSNLQEALKPLAWAERFAYAAAAVIVVFASLKF